MSANLVFAYPGNLDLNTGGYGYDRRIIKGLGATGWSVVPLALGEGFPMPSTEVRIKAERLLSEFPDDTLIMIDGLAFGVLDDWAEREAKRLKIVALVHHPLALESGLDTRQQARLRQSERRSLSFVRHTIVTSQVTAREIETTYGVRRDRITAAIPGTDRAPVACGNGEPPQILSIGTLTPRKGHDVLIAALKQVEHLDWQATIIGSRALNPETAARLEQQIEDVGLAGRIWLAGECADVRGELAGADIFALASRYEGYGMVFAEALSQGLPIVACKTGAIPDVVPEDAGILVPVDDIDAFAHALQSLLTDKTLRRSKSEASLLAGARLPGWDETTDIIATTLKVLG